MNRAYIDSVQLLLDAAPAVFRSGLFALKGGTAINLFTCSAGAGFVFLGAEASRPQRVRTLWQ